MLQHAHAENDGPTTSPVVVSLVNTPASSLPVPEHLPSLSRRQKRALKKRARNKRIRQEKYRAAHDTLRLLHSAELSDNRIQNEEDKDEGLREQAKEGDAPWGLANERFLKREEGMKSQTNKIRAETVRAEMVSKMLHHNL